MIAQLAANRLLKIQKGSTRPAYALAKKGTPIWLPNALVDGAAGEVPPVARIRQTQNPMALRLLVELYREQNLREDSGVKPSVIWSEDGIQHRRYVRQADAASGEMALGREGLGIVHFNEHAIQ